MSIDLYTHRCFGELTASYPRASIIDSHQPCMCVEMVGCLRRLLGPAACGACLADPKQRQQPMRAPAMHCCQRHPSNPCVPMSKVDTSHSSEAWAKGTSETKEDFLYALLVTTGTSVRTKRILLRLHLASGRIRSAIMISCIILNIVLLPAQFMFFSTAAVKTLTQTEQTRVCGVWWCGEKSQKIVLAHY